MLMIPYGPKAPGEVVTGIDMLDDETQWRTAHLLIDTL